jgi:hypothetical protein
MENKETRKTTMFCLKHTDSKRGTYFSDFYNHKTALAVCYGAYTIKYIRYVLRKSKNERATIGVGGALPKTGSRWFLATGTC